jgi:GNAT superfamily N-acetyltransferase
MLDLAITLRPADAADAEFVYRLTEACMRAYAVATWGRWNEDATRASFRPATHRIVQVDDRDIGCVALEQANDHLFVDSLYILPDWQNRGIGTGVMRDVVAAARAGGKSLRLNVLAANPARRFYERMGFVVTQSTPERHYMEWRGA